MAAKRKTATRSTRKRSSPKMAASSGWVEALYASQTGRTIVAEMLVAAAGAAAAVLLSTEKGRQAGAAMAEAGRDAVGTIKKSGKRAAAAASSALDSAAERAGAISTAAAKASGLHHEPTQQELAEKALEMRNQNVTPSRSDAATKPRYPGHSE